MYNSWEELKKDCSTCQRCELGLTRTNLVFGIGNEKSEVLFIGKDRASRRI
jgi:uracil-DNA glycosylase